MQKITLLTIFLGFYLTFHPAIGYSTNAGLSKAEAERQAKIDKINAQIRVLESDNKELKSEVTKIKERERSLQTERHSLKEKIKMDKARLARLEKTRQRAQKVLEENKRGRMR